MTRLFSAVFVLCASGIALAQTAPGGFAITQYGGAAITSGTAMAWAPDGRLFVCQQGGALRVIKGGTLLTTAFHTATVDSPGGSERGLLGIAFDPDFLVNKYVYIYYTNPTPSIHNCIRRLKESSTVPDTSDGTETVIADLDNLSGATNHNGGAMHFGIDGKLYVAVGENASSSNAQMLTNRLGKILRYNPDGTIPADNPSSFPNIAGSTTGANKAIWSVGLRNPYTFAFQPGTGRMFINDVGEVTWEEINEGLPGLNYGWIGGTSDGVRNVANMTDPIYVYNHSTGTPIGSAITGGCFYNPATLQFPGVYAGKYFFADYVTSFIRFLDPASPGSSSTFITGANSPVDLQVGPDGMLYYLARGGTQGVYQVKYTAVVVQNIIVSTEKLTVNEGGTSAFNVALALNPAGPLAVTVVNSSGLASVTATPNPINFNSGNWQAGLTVTVSAPTDVDGVDNGATLTLTSGSLAPKTVVVTAVDTSPAPVSNHPLARISLPLNGDVVSGSGAEFFGNGTPMGGAAMVKADFYIDGVLTSTDTNSSGHYHINGSHDAWNTTVLTNGTHVLRMTVTDNNGTPRTGSHEITVTVSNSAGGGGGGGGGGCGATGLEGLALAGFLALLRRRKTCLPSRAVL